MKNSIPFYSDEFCTSYSKALIWLTNFNTNLPAGKKIYNWNISYKEHYLILKF